MLIVDHITAGNFPGCLTWLRNPAARGSAHFLVTKAGEIYQLVKEEDSAWANGFLDGPTVDLDWVRQSANPNWYSLSIEHEGWPGDVMPEAQYQATLWLHRYLIDRHGIPVDTTHIIGHYRLDSVDRPNCPGRGFPWDRLFTDLVNQEVEVMLEQWQTKLGTDSVNELAQKGLIKDPEAAVKDLAAPIPAWKMYALLNRIFKGDV